MTEPERIARTFLMAKIDWVLGYDEVEEEVGGVTSGSTIFRKAPRVFSGTPASVKSLMAPLNKPQPCWKMRMEMRVPRKVGGQSQRLATAVCCGTLPPRASSGRPGTAQVPTIAAKATALEYASLLWCCAFASNTGLFSSSATFFVNR